MIAFLTAESRSVKQMNSVHRARGITLPGRWSHSGTLISSEVMHVGGGRGGGGGGGGWGYCLSGPNRSDQPADLSPVLRNDGLAEELISLGTLGNAKPASCANKIW